LGLDQGEACGAELRAYIAKRGLRPRSRWWPAPRRLTGGPVLGAGLGRETLRHYPHLGERLSGIARAAGVSLDVLMELQVEAAYASAGGASAAAESSLCAAARNSDGTLLLARTLRADLPWVLRRSRPEVGFASIEVTLPWSASAVAGVNEAGLSVSAVALPAAGAEGDEATPLPLSAPPAWLLVQECLQRFDTLVGASEWCAKRPASGAVALLLCDTAGQLVRVEMTGKRRSVVRSDAELAVCGAPREAEAAVEKELEDGAAINPLRFGQPESAQAWLSPREARLSFVEASELATLKVGEIFAEAHSASARSASAN